MRVGFLFSARGGVRESEEIGWVNCAGLVVKGGGL